MISRAIRKLLGKSGRGGADGKVYHPFDEIPRSLDVRWVLNVGANDGGLARASLRTFPGSSIICFEPVAGTFERLTETLRPFGDRAYLYKLALSDRSGPGEIHLTTSHGANSIEPQSPFHRFFNPHVREEGREAIALARLDDIAETLPAREIDLMVIDVEGHELNVLRGGERFIRDHVDTMIIEVALMRDQSWESQAVFEIFGLLNGLGFNLINVFDLHRSDRSDMILVQMDCVFRQRSKLRVPPLN